MTNCCNIWSLFGSVMLFVVWSGGPLQAEDVFVLDLNQPAQQTPDHAVKPVGAFQPATDENQPATDDNAPEEGAPKKLAPADPFLEPQPQPEEPVSPTVCPSCGNHHCDDCGPWYLRWLPWKRSCRSRHEKRPPYYVPPAGTAMHAILQKQRDNGQAALMVLYQFDFQPGEVELGPGGVRQLAKIASRLEHNSFPIIIELTPGRPSLDEQRRKQVIDVLSALSVPVDDERVVIGTPPAHGLDGIDAVVIGDPSGALGGAGLSGGGSARSSASVAGSGGFGGAGAGGASGAPSGGGAGMAATPGTY